MTTRWAGFFLVLAATAVLSVVRGQEDVRAELEGQFTRTVRPFLETWQSSESPVPNEMYPSLAFDRLFENGGRLRNTSVLDRVKDHALALSGKISSSDKLKLDEYLASLREVERSIERMRTDKDKAEERARDAGQ